MMEEHKESEKVNKVPSPAVPYEAGKVEKRFPHLYENGKVPDLRAIVRALASEMRTKGVPINSEIYTELYNFDFQSAPYDEVEELLRMESEPDKEEVMPPDQTEAEAALAVSDSKKAVYGQVCKGLGEAQDEFKELFKTGFASDGLREAIRLLAEAEKVVRKELHRS